MSKSSFLAVLAVFALAGCHQQPATQRVERTDAATMAANAESGVFFTGTLAALGSFEWDVAPLLNHNATARHNAAVALRDGRITKDEAQRILDVTDSARKLIDQALAACAQSPRTAKCTKDEHAGRALLEQARQTLAEIP